MSKRLFIYALDYNRITQAFTMKVNSEVFGLTTMPDGRTALVVGESNKPDTVLRTFIQHADGQAVEDYEQYIGSYIGRIGNLVHVCEQMEKSGWPDV